MLVDKVNTIQNSNMKNKVIRLNENDIENLVRKIIKEDSTVNETHEDNDEGKIEYIKSALKNLSSKDLDKIYLSVEEYDPYYED